MHDPGSPAALVCKSVAPSQQYKAPLKLGTVAICIAEDWFAASHFKALITFLVQLSDETIIITRFSGKQVRLAALGATCIDFDFARETGGAVREPIVAMRLSRLLKAHQVDIAHFVSIRMVAIGIMACRLAGCRGFVAHVTGLGQIASRNDLRARILRGLALRATAWQLRSASSWLFVENRDDLSYLNQAGVDPGQRHTVLGGAGIDTDHYTALPPPLNEQTVIAFAGRLVHQKGLHVLINAHKLLVERGVRHKVEIYGAIDPDSEEPYSLEQIRTYTSNLDVDWLSYANDVRSVWRSADIAVVPSVSREGMPRAMLEAASCARPLVVTDIPGSADFVRNGVEGFIAKPNDPLSLANALQRLIEDYTLRLRMGEAARNRVIAKFSEGDFVKKTLKAYQTLFQAL